MPGSDVQSSFIPHEEDFRGGVRVRPSGIITLLMLLSIVLFVASAVLAGGVFLYLQYLQTDKQSKEDSLQRAEQQFDPSLLTDLSTLDDRLKAATVLLNNHVAPSALLQLLEQSTITTLGYAALTLDASNPASISVKMDGVADSVNTVALEADILSKNKAFVTPIFTNINREADGVHFNVSATLSTKSLAYAQYIGGASATQAPAPGASLQAATQQQQNAPASSTPFSGPPKTKP